MKFSVSDFYLVLVALLTGKILAFGCSFGEAAGALVILASLQTKAVIDFLFPKRPDLFKEMLELRAQIDQLQIRTDDLQRSVSALNIGMGAVRR